MSNCRYLKKEDDVVCVKTNVTNVLDKMGDDELAQIRAKRMAELQAMVSLLTFI